MEKIFLLNLLTKLLAIILLYQLELLFLSLIGSSFSCFVSLILSISTTFPSLMWMIRSLYSLANSSLWVTIITNALLLAFFKDSITSKALSLSKAPVGSSAKMRRGLFINPRIIAILSFSPPDNLEHFLSNKSLLIEKLSIKDKTFFFALT